MPSPSRLRTITAEQPSTTYADFKRELLNEIARCLNMPFNIAAGNSSSYNYSSGRLDHQTYFKSQRVDQAHMERIILEEYEREMQRARERGEAPEPGPSRHAAGDYE
jgi:capsid protein